MSRADKAKAYFIEGYNCSQAVALAFQDVVNVDKQTLLKIMLPFGGGMGRLRLTCGAVSGMVALIGLIFGEAEHGAENKKDVYMLTQKLCAQFKEEHGSLICSELLQKMNVPVEVGGVAEARTKEYYKKRSCADTVYSAAAILENYLKEVGKL